MKNSHKGFSTPLVIAIMAFAVVSFLFLIDTAINPDGAKKVAKKAIVSNSNNSNGSVNQNTNTVPFKTNANFLTNRSETNQNTNSVDEAPPVIVENPVGEVEELSSSLFKTPYNNGYISGIKCMERYCLITSSSAGWVYNVVRFENGNFSEVYSYAATDTDRAYDEQIDWNGEYWLVTSGTKLLRYDGQTASLISIPDNTCTIQDVQWNGQYWLIATLCVGVSDVWGKIITYDGTTFTTVTESYPGIQRIVWNGKIWGLAGIYNGAPYSVAVKTPFLTYDGKTFTDYSDKFTSVKNLTLGDFVWNDRWEFAYRHYVNIEEPTSLYAFDGATLKDISSSLQGFEKTEVGFLSAGPIYAIGGHFSSILNVYRDGNMHNISKEVPHDVYSLEALDKNTLYVGSSEGKFYKVSFIHE